MMKTKLQKVLSMLLTVATVLSLGLTGVFAQAPTDAGNYRPGSSTAPTPDPGNRSDGDSPSPADEAAEAESQFWKGLMEEIQNAEDGDVVTTNAKSYLKMPVSVMRALYRNSGVTLVLNRNGGGITIPAGETQKPDVLRVFYRLDSLAELYAEDAE